MKRTILWTALAVSGALYGCSSDEDSATSPSSDQGGPSGNSASIGSSGDIASEGAAPFYSPTVDEETEVGGAGGMAGEDPVEIFSTNPFVVADHDPLSTFAADVDTASYGLFMRAMEFNDRVDPSTVRLEEFVNFFEYEYPAPAVDAEHPFEIHLAAAPSLVDTTTQMLRVGIQGKSVPLSEKPATNLVFLIDVSGSMSEELSSVKAILEETVELMDPTDTISLVTYASNPGVALEATPVSEKDAILAAIDALQSGGSTNGSGGINAAYEQAESVFVEGGINHILLCTDGDFNVGVTSHDSLEELIEEKRESGVTLTALGFGSGNFQDERMERISNVGNGIYAYIGSEEDAREYGQEKLLQTVMHIAKDMKLQVEFNPEHVEAYRLLGYENRAIADEDFRDDVVDAGEIGSGHRVTALYEIVLKGGSAPDVANAPPLDDGAAFSGAREVAADDLVLVKVRYKEPGASTEDAATEVSASMTPGEVSEGFEGAESDVQWAVAVAAFAEIAKQSPYADESELEAIFAVLESQASRDDDRAEFAEAVRTFAGLTAAP